MLFGLKPMGLNLGWALIQTDMVFWIPRWATFIQIFWHILQEQVTLSKDLLGTLISTLLLSVWCFALNSQILGNEWIKESIFQHHLQECIVISVEAISDIETKVWVSLESVWSTTTKKNYYKYPYTSVMHHQITQVMEKKLM